MTHRKTVTRLASSIGRKGLKDSMLSQPASAAAAALVPVAPTDDTLTVEVQREKRLGPDFDPGYFASLDLIIEEKYGPPTGAFKVVSG